MEFASRFVSALFFLSSISVMNVMSKGEQQSCGFNAIFNFGDSNSDTGGSMGSPSGETYFGKPSGRASDGRLIIDFMAQHLGLPYLNAYRDSVGSSFQHGANFATGGSTVLHYDGSWFEDGISPFTLDAQVEQFIQFKARTRDLNTKDPLYIFDIGQNDIGAGFRQTNYKEFRGSVYEIVKQISASVQKLYNQGARTFWIHNTGPLGCLALNLQYTQNNTSDLVDSDHCIKAQNSVAMEFNQKLKNEVYRLRSELPDAALTYVDIFTAKRTLITRATMEGFMNSANICCGLNQGETFIWCGQSKTINGVDVFAGSCKDPSKSISWDGIHYTEAANQWVSNHIIYGSLSDPQIPISLACRRSR